MSKDVTLSGGLNFDSVALTAVQTSGESFADNDTSLMTSAAINDLIGANGATLAGLGITSTASELNILDGVTATTAELNILDGVTATAAELNYVDGVTSAVQTQIDTVVASAARELPVRGGAPHGLGRDLRDMLLPGGAGHPL